MTTPNDGGPAFPLRVEANDSSAQLLPGISLRDYFAAKAMQSYLSMNYEECARSPEKLAIWAYENADAMLAAREP